MRSFKRFLFFILLSCCSIQTIWAQADTMKMFIFGHSLIDHRPPLIPTPSNETTVPHWIYLLAQEAGYNYAAGGQYGFLPQHRNLPPIAQWGYDIVPGVWDSDNEPYSAADMKHVMITAGNFVQWQAPNLEYPTDPGITPISATEDIVDWVDQEEDSVRFYIYENWPDMASYLGNGFPPTNSEFASYNNYTLGDFHDWWLEYHDSLLLSRPDFKVRMIPIGPIISKIHTDLIPNLIPIQELYEDDAPHGRATTYFLAGLINYMAVYEEKAPATFVVPSIVHPVVQDSFEVIVNFAWEELINFNDSNGDNRVFFDDITSLVDMTANGVSLSIYPNPTTGYFQIEGALGDYEIDILDSSGSVYQNLNTNSNLICININSLPAGQYLLRIYNKTNNTISVEKIIKEN